MRPNSLTQVLAGALLAGLTWGFGSSVRADPIQPGYDLFATQPGTIVSMTGIGPVALKGVPIGPGNTDTIVQRLQGIDPFPVGGIGTVPIELTALSLMSVAPINIGGSFFDMHVIGGTSLGVSESLGSMTVSHSNPNGGTFTSTLPVHAILTFTQVGNPSNTNTMDSNAMLIGAGVWSHTPGPNDAHNAIFPAGLFYPAVDPITGMALLLQETGQGTGGVIENHIVAPAQVGAVPEPATLTLLGIAGMAGYGWRRRKQAST